MMYREWFLRAITNAFNTLLKKTTRIPIGFDRYRMYYSPNKAYLPIRFEMKIILRFVVIANRFLPKQSAFLAEPINFLSESDKFSKIGLLRHTLLRDNSYGFLACPSRNDNSLELFYKKSFSSQLILYSD